MTNKTSDAAGQKVQHFYREAGAGHPLLFLHGGWGYGAYPFDRQIQEFGHELRILIPDRYGYGRSGRIGEFPLDFHHRAAMEMIYFLDAHGCERAVLWGHSDGAVISAWMGIEQPARFPAIIFEAFHYYRNKPRSRAFFETGATNPERFGKRLSQHLAEEHGEDYWRVLMRNASEAWLSLADQAPHPKADLFHGKLPQLSVPTLFVHGAQDPRTEPDEFAQIRRELPAAEIHLIEGAGHSPHSEPSAFSITNQLVRRFLARTGISLLSH